MKKYLLLLILVVSGIYANSQELKTVRNLILLKQFDKAKPEIDKFLAVEKNAANSEAWYYKAFIYNSLGRLPGKTIPESKALFDASYEALKKYVEMDPKLTFTNEEQNSTLFNIYYGFYDLGVKTYNEKNFTESFDNFKKALDVHDYIYNKQFTGGTNIKFSAHDTDVVWNLAVLSNELKRKDDALIYFKKIVDADLSAEKYATAYDEIISKYKREKNTELFTKYLAAAKKHYPIDKAYWEKQEIDYTLGDLENEALLNKYEELITNLPGNYMLYYNYAVEIDKYLMTPDAKNVAAYKNKITELFKKALEVKSTTEVNLQLANIYYSKYFDIKEHISKIKGTKPDEVKLKNELTAQSKSTMNEAIPYAEEAVKQLGELKEYKFAEKTNYKLAVEILISAYKQLGNAAKVAEYEKLKLVVDKL